MIRQCLVLTACLATAAWPQSYRVSTFAGGGSVRDGGPAVNAYLATPYQVAYDKSGNLYICDTFNHRIRIVAPDGTIRTLAGTGEPGSAGDGGPAASAQLNAPRGIAIDAASGAVWIGEAGRIRQVQPNGNIRSVAVGGGIQWIASLALNSDGSVYASDSLANRVWRISAGGTVTAAVGTGTAGYSGDGGPATNARLNSPLGIALTAQGALLIADHFNSAVRRVADGTITTLVGNGHPGIPTSGQPPTGPVALPESVLVDAQGNLWVGSIGLLRFPSGGAGPLQIVSTTPNFGFAGDGGAVTGALFENISSLVQAPDQSIVLSDSGNHRVRRINSLNTIATVAGSDRTAFEGPASNAVMSPSGLAVDANGNVYIGHVQGASGAILQVKPNGQISRFAGSGSIRPILSGGAASGMGMKPRGLAIAPDGSILYAEADVVDRHAVRRVRDGRVETVAGRVKTTNNNLSVSGNTGDGGPSESALLNDPWGAWADRDGAVYIADSANRRVRRVQGANIAAFAGAGVAGSGGDGASALQASLRFPTSIVGDRRGNIYIADFGDHRIRRVTPAGVISTFAGNGTRTASGDGGPAAQAGLPLPFSLAIDGADNLYVTSSGVVRKIDGNGTISTIAGGGTASGTADRPALEARFEDLGGIAVASDGRIFVAEINRVLVLSPVAGGGGGGGGTGGAKALTANAATNNQSGSPGTVLPRPLTVRYTDNGQPVAGIPVDFAVTAGAATLSASRVTTGSDGSASVTVTLGAVPGVTRIRAAAPDTAAVEFVVTTLRSDGLPQIRQVVTASAFGGDARIAPGTWVEISGNNLSAATREWGGADFVNGTAPTTLDGVSVSVGGRPAFVRYISPGQVNVQIPFDIPVGQQALRVTTAAGVSDPVNLQVAARVPGVLAPPDSFNIGGRQYLAALFADGSFVLPPGAIAGLATRRAKAGDRILVYAIGCGAGAPEFAAGVPAPQAALPDVTARIGTAAATVEYAGTSPGAIGLYQFNLVVPPGVSGDVAFNLTIGGVAVAQQTVLAVE